MPHLVPPRDERPDLLSSSNVPKLYRESRTDDRRPSIAKPWCHAPCGAGRRITARSACFLTSWARICRGDQEHTSRPIAHLLVSLHEWGTGKLIGLRGLGQVQCRRQKLAYPVKGGPVSYLIITGCRASSCFPLTLWLTILVQHRSHYLRPIPSKARSHNLWTSGSSSRPPASLSRVVCCLGLWARNNNPRQAQIGPVISSTALITCTCPVRSKK